MPVNVDTVYQTVQALANKEQRGYLTPHEFNLFANQAQQDIFEQYLYDLNAVREARPLKRELGNSVSFILTKLKSTSGISVNNNGVVAGGTNVWQNQGVYTGEIFVTISGHRRTVRQITSEEIYDISNSRWHMEGFKDVVYFEDGINRIQVWSGIGGVLTQITSGVTCERISGKPGVVIWGYSIVNEKPIYNSTNSQNFDLDVSEQTDLVAKILKLAGISIENQQLYQAAQAEESLNTQQESK